MDIDHVVTVDKRWLADWLALRNVGQCWLRISRRQVLRRRVISG